MDPYAIYAHIYDLDLGDLAEDLPMYLGFAARCGSPILELACGTGRVLLPLARAGYRVTGVDISPSMLEQARAKVASEGLEDRVTLVEQDMQRLSLDGQYAMAFVAVNSFMHLLTTDAQLTTLCGVGRHLRPGGLLVLDLFNPDLVRLVEPPGQVTLRKIMTDPATGHRLMKFDTKCTDLAQQTIHTTYIVDDVDNQGGVTRTLFAFSIRYLFRGELELLLRQSGYELEALYGSYDLDEFDGDSERMIAVARWKSEAGRNP